MGENLDNIDFSIIWKKLHTSLTEEEEQQLKEWLEENREHQAYFDHVVRFYENGSQFGKGSIPSQKAWPEFAENLKSRNIKRFNIGRYASVAAAAIILILAVTAVLKPSIFNVDNITPGKSVTSIQPGTEKAILLMDDGTSHQLSSEKKLSLEEGGSHISSQGNTLEYSQGKKEESRVKYNTLVIPRGGRFNLTLADGTRIWLNAGSTLKYPTVFPGDQRKVELTGEAYFEVAKDTEKPFRVLTENQVLEVLGTIFNISSYKESPSILTTLVEGKVNVFLENHPEENQTLFPDHQSVLIRGQNILQQRKVDVREYVSWKDGWFYFRDQPLEEIMHNLSRWYDVEVKFENQDAKKLPFTGEIRRYEDLENVLVLLEKTGDVEFNIERRTLIVK